MKQSKVPFNIHDLNFVLTFVGFAFFTSFFSFIPSVTYRAFALGVALICLLSNRLHLGHLSGALKAFLIVFILMACKTTAHLLLEWQPFIQTRNLVLLFIWGVTLLPVIAFISGHEKIHWDLVVVILEILLVALILKGLLSSAAITDDVRISLNNRQSTLAFGDNAGYLSVLSCCLFRKISRIKNKLLRLLVSVLLIGAFVLGVLGMARAASRGPVVAGIVGCSFVFFTLRFSKKLVGIITAIIVISLGGITIASIERLAPVLFLRMSNTINEGDMSGREVLFEQAIEQIKAHPITGNNPVILYSSGFTSCHNGYLEVGVGLGIFGFAAFVVLNLWILFVFIRNRRNIIELKQLLFSSMFFLSATRAMTGASLLDNPNYTVCIAGACIVSSTLFHYQRQNLS